MKRIGWENGVLVSKAKVNIGGSTYDVEPEQYEGNTPLSAENLKKMEDNMEEGLNEVISEIIERGQNSNVSYVKLIDGTMIQYGYNNGVDNGERVITFPIPFIETPVVSCNTVVYDTNYVHLTQVHNISKTGCSVIVRYISSSGGSWGIGGNGFSWIAIGKWK